MVNNFDSNNSFHEQKSTLNKNIVLGSKQNQIRHFFYFHSHHPRTLT